MIGSLRYLMRDYRDAIENAQKGDFIYLDPPYQPLNNTSYFTAYTKDGFDDRDQTQLADVFRKLNSVICSPDTILSVMFILALVRTYAYANKYTNALSGMVPDRTTYRNQASLQLF